MQADSLAYKLQGSSSKDGQTSYSRCLLLVTVCKRQGCHSLGKKEKITFQEGSDHVLDSPGEYMAEMWVDVCAHYQISSDQRNMTRKQMTLYFSCIFWVRLHLWLSSVKLCSHSSESHQKPGFKHDIAPWVTMHQHSVWGIWKKKDLCCSESNTSQRAMTVYFLAVVGSIKLSRSLGFPGDPVVKTQCFQGRDEGGFDPWSGN